MREREMCDFSQIALCRRTDVEDRSLFRTEQNHLLYNENKEGQGPGLELVITNYKLQNCLNPNWFFPLNDVKVLLDIVVCGRCRETA